MSILLVIFLIFLFTEYCLVVTDTEVRLQLAEEDANDLAIGRRLSIHDDVTPSMLIYQGLELEDLQ